MGNENPVALLLTKGLVVLAIAMKLMSSNSGDVNRAGLCLSGGKQTLDC